MKMDKKINSIKLISIFSNLDEDVDFQFSELELREVESMKA
jgi:hypothetical protein